MHKSDDKSKEKVKEKDNQNEKTLNPKINKTALDVKKDEQKILKIEKKEIKEKKKGISIDKKEIKTAKDTKIKIEKKSLSPNSNKENKDNNETIDSKENIKVKNHKNNDYISNDEDLTEKYFEISKINNIQIPKEYINVIYHNLLKEEEKGIKPMPDHTYMSRQNEINEKMRSILVDWIIDVHFKFGFTDETLFMTVSIIDRYLSVSQITRTNFQLLGITALMIACKHEEIDLPKIDDFIYITDNAYVKSEVIKMEEQVLDKLNFAFLYPSPIKFFEYLSLKFNFDKKQFFFGKYLMETFLLNLICIKYFPSIIACAAAYIVMKFFKLKNYKESYLKQWYMIEGKEGFNFIEPRCGVKDCAQEMCNFVDNIGSTNYLSCQKKYESEECCCISKLILNYADKDEKNKNKN